jgi:uncharacterized membrane protein
MAQKQGRGPASQASRRSGTGGKPGGGQGGGTRGGSSAKAGRASGTGSAGRGGATARRGSANGGSANRGGQEGREGRPAGPDRPRSGGSPTAATASGAGPGGTGQPRPAAPRWLQLTTLILSLLGLAVSIYLTIAHFTAANILACPSNSFINCGEVTSSSQSMVFGIFPVAVLGLAFYVFLVAVNTPWAWRAPWPQVRWARVGSLVVGMGFVLYLVYAELIQIGKLCEYCTAVHVITFVLFVLIMFNATAPSQSRTPARR